jgi:hypothetical protein
MGSFIARVSASNEAAALQRLASACQAQTAAYPTTLQADETLPWLSAMMNLLLRTRARMHGCTRCARWCLRSARWRAQLLPSLLRKRR